MECRNEDQSAREGAGESADAQILRLFRALTRAQKEQFLRRFDRAAEREGAAPAQETR